MPTQTTDIVAICATAKALDSVGFGDSNMPYSRIYHTRLQALCELKGCELADLTLREITSCRAAADLDYNEQFPVLFPGHQPRNPADVLGQHPQGALL